jgi:hypothetical protein
MWIRNRRAPPFELRLNRDGQPHGSIAAFGLRLNLDAVRDARAVP